MSSPPPKPEDVAQRLDTETASQGKPKPRLVQVIPGMSDLRRKTIERFAPTHLAKPVTFEMLGFPSGQNECAWCHKEIAKGELDWDHVFGLVSDRGWTGYASDLVVPTHGRTCNQNRNAPDTLADLQRRLNESDQPIDLLSLRADPAVVTAFNTAFEQLESAVAAGFRKFLLTLRQEGLLQDERVIPPEWLPRISESSERKDQPESD